MESNQQYLEKQEIQEAQYGHAYHWRIDRRVENARYTKFTELLADLIAQQEEVIQSGAVLICDFGCGDGRGSSLLYLALKERGIKASLVGVDVSERAIELARQNTDGPGSEDLVFSKGDITDGLNLLASDGAPRVVVMREVIEHLPEELIDAVLKTISQSVPQCSLLVTTPTVNSPVARKHFRHYTSESLDNTLERNGFEICKTLGYGFRPRLLYKPMVRLKNLLNRRPLLWRTMNPCWRTYSPRFSITLVSLARPALVSKNEGTRSEN